MNELKNKYVIVRRYRYGHREGDFEVVDSVVFADRKSAEAAASETFDGCTAYATTVHALSAELGTFASQKKPEPVLVAASTEGGDA